MSLLSKEQILYRYRFLCLLMILLFFILPLSGEEFSPESIEQDILDSILHGVEEEELEYEFLPLEMISLLSEQLKEKEKELSEKENYLLDKEKHLEQKEIAIREMKAELNAIREFIEDAVSRRESIHKEELRQLINLYEQMRPRNAAIALQSLFQKDRDIAVEIVKNMQAMRAGKLMDSLSQIDPNMVAEISKVLGSPGFISQ